MKIRIISIFTCLVTLCLLASSSQLTVGARVGASSNRPLQAAVDDKLITAENLMAKLKHGDDVLIYDVRTEGQFKSSGQRIKGDIRLEEATLDETIKDVPKDRFIVTYCTCPDEATSNYFAEILRQKGYKNVRALKGGYYAWLRIDGPLEGK